MNLRQKLEAEVRYLRRRIGSFSPNEIQAHIGACKEFLRQYLKIEEQEHQMQFTHGEHKE